MTTPATTPTPSAGTATAANKKVFVGILIVFVIIFIIGLASKYMPSPSTGINHGGFSHSTPSWFSGNSSRRSRPERQFIPWEHEIGRDVVTLRPGETSKTLEFPLNQNWNIRPAMKRTVLLNGNTVLHLDRGQNPTIPGHVYTIQITNDENDPISYIAEYQQMRRQAYRRH